MYLHAYTKKHAGDVAVRDLNNLPPGFEFVYVSDGEVEMCPGAHLVSPERWPKCPAHIEGVEDSMIKQLIYCTRKGDVPYTKGLKRVPRYLKIPKLKGCDAVTIPTIFELADGINLILGASIAPCLEIPVGVLVVQVHFT